ncbi:hypothetical protein GCM10023238_14450 [Streptomyces heliomycini]
MLIGATGSGKSELLRTLVLGLALTNSSETLNFVLVDFKGGATSSASTSCRTPRRSSPTSRTRWRWSRGCRTPCTGS